MTRIMPCSLLFATSVGFVLVLSPAAVRAASVPVFNPYIDLPASRLPTITTSHRLDATPVPEPSTLAWGTISLAALTLIWRGRGNRVRSAILGIAAVLGFANVAQAEQVIFTIDPAQSSQTWFGNDDVRGPFVPYAPGTLTTGVSGHFVVDFDPTTHVPATVQFVGGHGYFKLDSSHLGPPTYVEGLGWTTNESPANVAGNLGAGGTLFALRDFLWDVASAPIAGTGGVFPANQTTVVYDGGAHIDLKAPLFAGSLPLNDGEEASVNLSGGEWTLSEAAPGSGDWTLSLTGVNYTDTYEGGLPVGNGTYGFESILVSTAHFGAANSAQVDPIAAPKASAGGVSAEFDSQASAGTLSVQQVPSTDSLSRTAAAAAEIDALFQLSTGPLAASPQIWNLDYSGALNGSLVTLVFSYDPLLLPPAIDESILRIWHFDSTTNQWEFGGTVDPLANTISYSTDSFSPFQLGAAVPEPSTFVIAASCFIGLAAWNWPRARRCRPSLNLERGLSS